MVFFRVLIFWGMISADGYEIWVFFESSIRKTLKNLVGLKLMVSKVGGPCL